MVNIRQLARHLRVGDDLADFALDEIRGRVICGFGQQQILEDTAKPQPAFLPRTFIHFRTFGVRDLSGLIGRDAERVAIRRRQDHCPDLVVVVPNPGRIFCLPGSVTSWHGKVRGSLEDGQMFGSLRDHGSGLDPG